MDGITMLGTKVVGTNTVLGTHHVLGIRHELATAFSPDLTGPFARRDR
jgi:hypothetical protein